MTDCFEGFYIAVASAEGYYRTAKLIRSNITDLFEFSIKFSGPYVINMAFACELYLKGLLKHSKISYPCNSAKGHDLFVLYVSLPEADRFAVESNYHADLSLVDFLQSQKSIFSNRRYPFENKEINCSNPLYFKPLEEFTEALAKHCTSYCNQMMGEEAPADAH